MGNREVRKDAENNGSGRKKSEKNGCRNRRPRKSDAENIVCWLWLRRTKIKFSPGWADG